jgi:hypothetical protein
VSWARTPVAAALVDALEAIEPISAGLVSCFDRPPTVFNAPAYVVAYPDTVQKNTPAFGIDLTTISIICAHAVDQADGVDELLEAADKAINADLTLGGVVQVAQVKEQRSWRVFTIGGVQMLLAELSLEIHM